MPPYRSDQCGECSGNMQKYWITYHIYYKKHFHHIRGFIAITDVLSKASERVLHTAVQVSQYWAICLLRIRERSSPLVSLELLLKKKAQLQQVVHYVRCWWWDMISNHKVKLVQREKESRQWPEERYRNEGTLYVRGNKALVDLVPLRPKRGWEHLL